MVEMVWCDLEVSFAGWRLRLQRQQGRFIRVRRRYLVVDSLSFVNW
jgi:hypothetical protein